MTEVSERFAEVETRIVDACRRAGRARDEVRLVAISKRQPEERLEAAVALGHRDFGENYAQDFRAKQQARPELAWHFVGHLQRNKAKLVTEAALVHTLDSARLAETLDRLGRERARRIPVLVQIHQGGEATKSGIEADAASGLLASLVERTGLEVRGLMTLPPPGEGRRHFAALRELRDALAAETGLPLSDLSMGMSGDFEAAIAEGATIIRIGTALFGPRPA